MTVQIVRFLSVATVLSLSASLSAPAFAALGDCGQPITNNSRPMATDASFVLAAAVGNETCPNCECDVDNSGHVSSDDALKVLSAAVGIIEFLEEVFDCPSCFDPDPSVEACDSSLGLPKFNAYTGEQGTRSERSEFCGLPCNAADIMDAIEDHCALNKPGRFTFDCDNTTIVVDDTWDHNFMDGCDDTWISGGNRKIKFKLETPCLERCIGLCSNYTSNSNCSNDPADGDCSDFHCNSDDDCTGSNTCSQTTVTACDEEDDDDCVTNAKCGTDVCPNIDSGVTFLDLDGDDNVISFLTIEGFFNGIVNKGQNNTFRALKMLDQCDDSFTNDQDSAGAEVIGAFDLSGDLMERTLFSCGCDKCVQDKGDLAVTSSNSNDRDYYNVVYRGVEWIDCAKPYRITNNSSFDVDGRFLLDDVRMVDDPTNSQRCGGPEITMDGEFILTNAVVEGCVDGLKLGGATEATITESVFEDNELRGVAVFRNAEATVRRTHFVNNGDNPDSISNVLDIEGAIGVRAVDGNGNAGSFTPSIDLGLDSPSALRGKNKFECDNSNGVDYWISGTLDAERNCWCDDDPSAFVDLHGSGTLNALPRYGVNNSACKGN